MISQLHTPSGIVEVNSETCTDEELAALGTTFERLFPPETSTHIAQVVTFNPGAVKPLRLRRDNHGRWMQFDAFVSEDLKDKFLADTLQVGDWIHVDFVNGEIEQPLALTKIFKSWP